MYQKVNVKIWSKKIKERRLKWFGKVVNLPEEVPAKIALKYAMSDFKRPRGKPKTTWVSVLKKDLDEMNITFLEAENLCRNNIEQWKNMIKNFA